MSRGTILENREKLTLVHVIDTGENNSYFFYIPMAKRKFYSVYLLSKSRYFTEQALRRMLFRTLKSETVILWVKGYLSYISS